MKIKAKIESPSKWRGKLIIFDTDVNSQQYDDAMLTLTEIENEFNIKKGLMRRIVTEGIVPSTKLGATKGGYRIRRADLMAYLESNKYDPEESPDKPKKDKIKTKKKKKKKKKKDSSGSAAKAKTKKKKKVKG